MIKFDLICENQHIFEASFDDSNSFEKQKRKKQIECPFCNSSKISKSVMAPNISGKSTSSAKINREKKKMFSNYNKQLNKIKSEIEKNFTYVGKKFPEEARKIHYGEAKDGEMIVTAELDLNRVRECQNAIPVLDNDRNFD